MTQSFETFKNQCLELFTLDNLFKGKFFINEDNFIFDQLTSTYTWEAFKDSYNELCIMFFPTYMKFVIEVRSEFGQKVQVSFYSDELKKDSRACKAVVLRLFDELEEHLKTSA